MKGSIGTSMRIHIPKIKSKAKTIPEAKDNDICPFCKKGKLVLRQSKYGDFLGCSLYPKCKGVVKWH